jgi:hypothetical protein
VNPRLAFRRHTAPSIEPLEVRVAPAGLITATFTGGILTLNGDAAANELGLTSGAEGTFDLTGLNGTLIAFNGAAAAASVAAVGAIVSLKATMGAGADRLESTAVPLGAFSFDGGDGDDVVDLETTVVKGAFSFNGGNNDDTLSSISPIFLVGGALETAPTPSTSAPPASRSAAS